eukprot:CAMPEP_0203864212 /NCGR_PEP_ID=MMETSP0359-20131031/14632_1 /ASSEMBLY_ACC=CAM_ASM_000338 /TAXON_ID=268821 /ORGANISM="Scrippsiella Hangoei, Strain SHTV-5" /LENGTH=273 /DNA_ID=CAMNT_0050781909 /DNA_START=53 /DNA_END=874 /DNA_ORIENTATION=+
MARRALTPLVLLLAAPAAGAVSLAGHSALASGLEARAADWRAVSQAEADERRFWASEWSDLETDLERLHDVVEPAPAAHKKHEKSPLAGLKLNLEPKNPADLIPALTMLKGLYEDGKSRIGHLNVREKDLKAKFELKTAEHGRRIQAIDARFKNHTLSAEFKTNETRDETRLFSYWERVRERQHKQYHTSLKIQHGTLEKVKTMIDMYEKTISGKADKATISKELRKVGGGALPEIVFLQDTKTATARFCEDALKELRAAQKEGQDTLAVDIE